ncbi:MAG: hypothetical protein U9N48_01340 [Euryarchaeota archaeon]|nr:hypothetical protein [Euryarchaeota archaeon]
MRWLGFLLLIFVLLPSGAQALVILGDDVVSVDEPIEDDLFITGQSININAPVDSAVIAGGDIDINAPVKGDLFVVGGQVNVNSDVGGKIVAAGGTINIRDNVARNVVVAGGQVRIRSTSEIGRDVLILGGNVYNAGNINGTLTVRADSFQNVGTAGKVDFERAKTDPQWDDEASKWMSTFSILTIVGFFIVGLIILRLFPFSVAAVDREIGDSTAIKALMGFILIIATVVLIIISAVTVAGLPLAMILGLFFIAALMLTNLFVSYSLGGKISAALKPDLNDMLVFTIGYAILNVLFVIPYVGGLIKLVSVSLGFGAILYALNHQRHTKSEEVPDSI